MPTLTTQRGYTLIELMVTLSVSLIGTAGLLVLHGSLSKANALSSRQLEAANLAEDTIEVLRGQTVASLTEEYGALPIDEALPTVFGRNAMPIERRFVATLVGEPPMELVRLRVEVGWTDPGAQPGSEGGVYDHRVALELLRTRDESQ